MSKRNIIYPLWVVIILGAVIFVVSISGHATAQSTTHYVATNGVCNGATPCYDSIQTAVDAASAGDMIKVATGTYTSVASEILYIYKGVSVAGGYTPSNWNAADPINNPTILNAQSIPGRRVVHINTTNDTDIVAIQGLIMQNGYVIDDDGAGIYLQNGSLLLENSQLRNNTIHGVGEGGGLYIDGAAATISDSSISNNNARTGLLATSSTLVITNSVVENNNSRGIVVQASDVEIANSIVQNNGEDGFSLYTGGYSQVTLTDNEIRANLGDGIHGWWDLTIVATGNLIENNQEYGINLLGSDLANLTDNTVRNNREGGLEVNCLLTGSINDNVIIGNGNSTSYGGGISVNKSSLTLAGNLISENIANTGGGLHVSSTINCTLPTQILMKKNTFIGNQANLHGGTLFVSDDEGTVQISGENDMFVQNRSSSEAIYINGGNLTAAHWTLADNGNNGLVVLNGTAVLTNTIVANHTNAGFSGNNISANYVLGYNNGSICTAGASCTNQSIGNPEFINPAAGNYHIGSGSAAFNQAINANVNVDIDGDTRPACGGYDLGADEYTGGSTIAGLHVTEAITSTGALTVTLTWPSIMGANGIEIRYSSMLISDENWDSAIVITDTLVGTATTYTTTIPYNNDTIYFALRYLDSCGESVTSYNAFWPNWDIYLPTIFRM